MDDRWYEYYKGCVTGFVVGMLLFGGMMIVKQHIIREEAIMNGFGEYIDAGSGNFIFQWKK